MKKVRLLLVAVFGALSMAAAGAGVAWWLMKPVAAEAKTDVKAEAKGEEPLVDAHEFKYINLEKVVVMLRGGSGEPLSHYMAMDLVFKVPFEQEKVARQHLPLLRSIAVKAMSAYTMESATRMTVDQYAADINIAYKASYANERMKMPFVEAMIGKLIIE